MVPSGKTLDLFFALEPAADSGQRTVDAPSTIHHPLSAPEPSPPPTAEPAAHRRRARHLWLAICLSRLPLEALREVGSGRAGTERLSRPFVVVESTGSARHVLACNAAATRHGIVPGLGLNAAHALVSDLEVAERDRRLEEQLLERLATWAGQFTPRVSLAPPDGLLLEVRGSLRLFGGAQSLVSRIEMGLAASGLEAAIALAPSLLAALWLTRTGKRSLITSVTSLAGRLAPLPLGCTRWPESVLQSLQRMGVQTIGDCLRLPRDGFARRFGPELLQELDRSLVRLPEVRRSFRPRERFVWKQDFELELENVEQIGTALAPAVEELARFLRSRQAGVQGFELQLRHRSSAPTRLVIRLVAPARDASHFRMLLETRLERTVLPAPVLGARLRSAPLLMLPAAQTGLAVEAYAGDENRTSRLLERLHIRLGAGAVYGVGLVAEHRPERAWRKLAETPLMRRVKNPDMGTTALRPLWLLSEPQPLDVEGGWPYYEGRLDIERGPERIESGWWDGDDVARDYYVACTPRELRLWIYRERRADRRWFLHGVFG